MTIVIGDTPRINEPLASALGDVDSELWMRLIQTAAVMRRLRKKGNTLGVISSLSEPEKQQLEAAMNEVLRCCLNGIESEPDAANL